MDRNALMQANREFFSEGAINRRAQSEADRELKNRLALEGSFGDKQAAARELQGTFQDKAALDREMKGTFEQNRDLNLAVHGTAEGQNLAALDRMKYQQDAENWRSLLQYGPGSIRDYESRAMYGPGGIQERDIAARNYATEAGMWAHATPRAAYHYGTEETPEGGRRTVPFLGGRQVGGGGGQSYDWLSKISHKNPAAVETLHNILLLSGDQDKAQFLSELSRRNPDALGALREFTSKAGIGSGSTPAMSIEEQRQQARARLGFLPGAGAMGGGGPGEAYGGIPRPVFQARTEHSPNAGWYGAPGSLPESQPTRSYPGMTDIESPPGNTGAITRRGLPENYDVEAGIARPALGVMSNDQLAAHRRLLEGPPQLQTATAPAPVAMPPAARTEAQPPSRPGQLPIPARYVNPASAGYHSSRAAMAGGDTGQWSPVAPSYGANPMSRVARTYTEVNPNVVGPDPYAAWEPPRTGAIARRREYY